jgi:hypothetical protein
MSGSGEELAERDMTAPSMRSFHIPHENNVRNE